MDFTPYLAGIDTELRNQVARLNLPGAKPFHEMLTYHMGWTGSGAGTEAQGKRIRPLMALLVCESCDTPWLRAAPAAAAVEMIHNFSLVHDDIQDASDTRHNRPTVWSQWGVPFAINVGDAMFAIANHAVLDLAGTVPAGDVVLVARILNQACLDLTIGQYLDMSYEGRGDLDMEQYWPMVRGKTAALLSASCQVGALIGGADAERQEFFRSFGEHLGLAFQVEDDILGIWGDESRTGKPASIDLVEGKNSLPILYGLSLRGRFAERWMKGAIDPSEVGDIAGLLAGEGAHDFAWAKAQELTARALKDLEQARPQGAAREALFWLANKLVSRNE